MKRLVTLALLATLAAPAFAGDHAQINVNTATESQLCLLYRTGPALAAAIIDARPIESIEEFDAVKGIGPRWLEANGDFVAFEGETTLNAKVRRPLDPETGEPN